MMKVKFQKRFLRSSEVYIFLKSVSQNFDEYEYYFPEGIIKRGQMPLLDCNVPKSGEFFIIDA